MARTVTEAKLDSRTARARLKRGRQPHFRTLAPGRIHLGYVRKKEDRQGHWIISRYLAEGRYTVASIGVADDIEEADGTRVLSYEQAIANANAQIDAPKAPMRNLTVRAAVANYVAFKTAQGQPTGDLESRSKAHILPTLGDKVVAELTSERLRKWLADLAAAPAMKRSKRGGKQNYKADPKGDEAIRRRRASANRVLNMLRAALNHAYDEGHVTGRSAWDRRLKAFRNADAPRVRFLTVVECKRLINACDKEFRPLVRGALATGARYGELIRLSVANFNADAGTITIQKSKSGKSRHVVLTDEGVAFFRSVTAARAGSELVFQHTDGQPWKPSQQGRPMREACERAKITPVVGVHALRHTWASLSVMAGLSLQITAANMGHTDTRMTEKNYAHLSKSFVSDEIRARAPRFGFRPDKKVVTIAG